MPGFDEYVLSGAGSQEAGERAVLLTLAAGERALLVSLAVITTGPHPCLFGRPASACASTHAVLEAARELRAAEQQAAEARQQRAADATQAFAAEGLQQYAGNVLIGWHSWVQTGDGSVEALLAEARERQEAVEARAARRAHLDQLLAAEGLQGHGNTRAASDYVHSGEGSEEAVLQAAREAAAVEAARAQRRAQVEAGVAGEGILFESIRYVSDVHSFVSTGGGTLEAGEKGGDVGQVQLGCSLLGKSWHCLLNQTALGCTQATPDLLACCPPCPQRSRRPASSTRSSRRAPRALPP